MRIFAGGAINRGLVKFCGPPAIILLPYNCSLSLCYSAFMSDDEYASFVSMSDIDRDVEFDD